MTKRIFSMQHYGCLSISFKHCSVSLMTDFAQHLLTSPEKIYELKGDLKLDEVMILNTCNRIEIYFTTSFEATFQSVDGWQWKWFPTFPDEKKLPATVAFRLWVGELAVRHMHRVATSLESMVLGETQIFGQIKAAHQLSLSQKTGGKSLNFLVRSVVETAKQIYSETKIASEPVSVASMTYRTLQQMVPPTGTLVLVGAGEVIQSMVPYLKKHGNYRLIFVNRTVTHAELLTDGNGGQVFSLAEFLAQPIDFDGMIVCTASLNILFSASWIQQLPNVKCRLFIDLSNPVNIDPEIGSNPNTTLVNLGHIEFLAGENNSKRVSEIAKVEELIEAAMQKFRFFINERELTARFAELPEKAHQLKQEVVEKILATKLQHLSEKDQEVIHSLTDYLMKKFIQLPIVQTKDVFQETEEI